MLSKKTVKKELWKDKVIKKVLNYLESGWPTKKNLMEDETPFFGKREELGLEEGLLMWMNRLVIPKSLRGAVLQKLHEGHPGIEATKSLAKLTVWWPKINFETEKLIKNLEVCQKNCLIIILLYNI